MNLICIVILDSKYKVYYYFVKKDKFNNTGEQ